MPSNGVGANDPSTIGADVGTTVGTVLGEEEGKPSRYNDGLSHNEVGLGETDGIIVGIKLGIFEIDGG